LWKAEEKMQNSHHDLIELDEEYLDAVSGGGHFLVSPPTITFNGGGAYLAASTGTGAVAAVFSGGAIAFAGKNGSALAIGFYAGPITITL
jgi:hypothetical protein